MVRVRQSHDNTFRNPESAPVFFASEIARHYEHQRRWYRVAGVRVRVGAYYGLLRLLLRRHPRLRPCLKRCRQCRIFFLTDPRNAARNDLRCGFGCREAHRRASSTRRSVAYYRRHQAKKRALNRRRYQKTTTSAVVISAPPPHVQAPASPDSRSTPPPALLAHLRVMLGLIERRRVPPEAVHALWVSNWRQHSIASDCQTPYFGNPAPDQDSRGDTP